MGYVLNGEYFEGHPPADLVTRPVNSMHKQWEHDRQREEYRIDMVQPYKDGKPNEDFIEHYPEESKDYGFIKEEE